MTLAAHPKTVGCQKGLPLLTRRETRLIRWGVAIVSLGLSLGFWIPAFHPPESSHGPICKWYEAGNRSHFFQQLGLGFIPLMVGGTVFIWLQRRGRSLDSQPQRPAESGSSR